LLARVGVAADPGQPPGVHLGLAHSLAHRLSDADLEPTAILYVYVLTLQATLNRTCRECCSES